MTERTLIFNGKDVQIGYIEGNEVFDLAGRKRCNYIVATGNLYDSNNKVIGHVSLDGTFVGASWRCDELFGKPSGEAHAGPQPSQNAKSPRSSKAVKCCAAEESVAGDRGPKCAGAAARAFTAVSW